MTAIALHHNNRVDEVLEQARAGEIAFFVDLADENDGRAGFFSGFCDPTCARANLRHVSGLTWDFWSTHRLNRVDDGERGFCFGDRGRDDVGGSFIEEHQRWRDVRRKTFES